MSSQSDSSESSNPESSNLEGDDPGREERLVHFEGPWADEETKSIDRAAAAAESAGLPPSPREGGRPWIATKHVFPSFTLAIASRLNLDGTLTAPDAGALAAQIETAGRRQGDSGEAPSVFQLVYRSEAAQPMGGTELRELLRQARQKNHRLAVTGVLLYKAGGFLQVLEGREETVRALSATIREDPRHDDVETLLTTRAPRRVFPGWSMGLDNLEAVSADEPGVTSFLESGRLPADRDPLPEIGRALEQFKER